MFIYYKMWPLVSIAMFGKKGIRQFFFSWQRNDHDEVVQEKALSPTVLDQVKENSNKPYVW